MIYIQSDHTSPAYYFALEEFLMREKCFDDTVFMLWRTTPTVMLGNYQNTYQEINLPAVERDQVNLIRRNTGGGTIYTDENSFQFSFIKKVDRREIDFENYMDPVVKVLSLMGVSADYSSRNDLTIDGLKISGNAQSYKNGYTLHHGSLLYDMDFSKMADYLSPPKYKLESKGINSVRQRTTNIANYLPKKLAIEDFYDKFIEILLQEEAVEYQLTEEEESYVEDLAENKFKSWAWNFGENPPYSLSKTMKFKGGFITINLNVEEEKITSAKIYGDFFSANDLVKIEEALLGQNFRRDILETALKEVYAKERELIYNISAEDILACIFS